MPQKTKETILGILERMRGWFMIIIKKGGKLLKLKWLGETKKATMLKMR